MEQLIKQHVYENSTCRGTELWKGVHISPKSQLLLLGNFHLIFQPFLLFGAFFSMKVKAAQICLTLWLQGLYSPWNFPGQNTLVGSLSLLLGIFPTQGSNPGLPHCRWILYELSHQGSIARMIIKLFNNWYGIDLNRSEWMPASML